MISLLLIVWVISIYILFDGFLSVHSTLLKLILAFFSSFAFLSICFTFSLFLHTSFVVLCIFLAIFPLIYIGSYLYKLISKKTVLKPAFYPDYILITVFAGLIIFSYFFFKDVQRWGAWDNWAIWSLHARFLLDEVNYTNLFSNEILWTHPDYPLLLPSAIAMLWKGQTNPGPFVPMFISFITAISILLVMLSAFLEKKLIKTGLFVFVLLSVSGVLFPYVNSQLADSLVALFFLITLILFNQVDLEKPSFLNFLLGFFCACCPLIKNEGFPFFLFFSLFFFLKNYKKFRLLAYYLAGAFLPLALSGIFKVFYAPANDLFGDQTTLILSKLMNPERHKIILEYFFINLTTSKQYIIVLLLFAGIFIPRYFYSFSSGIIFLTFGCYYIIYVITPNDLHWHLSTSFDRLLHQVFPALLYSILLAYNNRKAVLPGQA